LAGRYLNIALGWAFTLFRTRDANALEGAGGGDNLVGGGEHDVLTGGSGTDSFVFNRVKDNAASSGRDQIVDFNSVENDIIDLSAIDANTRAGGAAEFVQKAAMSDMYEVEACKIAAQKGQSDQVKQFGQHMVEAQTKTREKLTS